MWYLRLLTLLGLSHTDSEDVAAERIDNAIVALKVRVDEADKKDQTEEELKEQLEKMNADLEKLTGERDALKEKMDQFEKEEEEKKDAADREALNTLADELEVPRNDSMDNAKFSHLVAKKVLKSLPDDASADYITGILQMARKDSGRTDTVDPFAKALGGGDGGGDDPKKQPGGNRDDADTGASFAEVQSKRYDASFVESDAK